jgi:hypothetical protein
MASELFNVNLTGKAAISWIRKKGTFTMIMNAYYFTTTVKIVSRKGGNLLVL